MLIAIWMVFSPRMRFQKATASLTTVAVAYWYGTSNIFATYASELPIHASMVLMFGPAIYFLGIYFIW
jgi:hypothetical protein